jgi:hypothetical protein
MHELLDDVFTPWTERSPAKAAGESLDPGEPDAEDLGAVAIENGDTCIGENRSHLLLLRRLEIVIAQNGDDGDLEDGEFANESARFFCETEVGQVAADDEHVGALVDLCEQRLQ